MRRVWVTGKNTGKRQAGPVWAWWRPATLQPPNIPAIFTSAQTSLPSERWEVSVLTVMSHRLGLPVRRSGSLFRSNSLWQMMNVSPGLRTLFFERVTAVSYVPPVHLSSQTRKPYHRRLTDSFAV